jgi:hypothetical protein
MLTNNGAREPELDQKTYDPYEGVDFHDPEAILWINRIIKPGPAEPRGYLSEAAQSIELPTDPLGDPFVSLGTVSRLRLAWSTNTAIWPPWLANSVSRIEPLSWRKAQSGGRYRSAGGGLSYDDRCSPGPSGVDQ